MGFQHKAGVTGEACPTKGDASIPSPLHTAPAPTRQGDHGSLTPDLCWDRTVENMRQKMSPIHV